MWSCDWIICGFYFIFLWIKYSGLLINWKEIGSGTLHSVMFMVMEFLYIYIFGKLTSSEKPLSNKRNFSFDKRKLYLMERSTLGRISKPPYKQNYSYKISMQYEIVKLLFSTALNRKGNLLVLENRKVATFMLLECWCLVDSIS